MRYIGNSLFYSPGLFVYISIKLVPYPKIKVLSLCVWKIKFKFAWRILYVLPKKKLGRLYFINVHNLFVTSIGNFINSIDPLIFKQYLFSRIPIQIVTIKLNHWLNLFSFWCNRQIREKLYKSIKFLWFFRLIHIHYNL